MTNLSDLFKPKKETAADTATSVMPQFEFIQEKGPSLAALMLKEIDLIDQEIQLKLNNMPTLDNHKKYTILTEATKACRDVIDTLATA